MSAEPTAPLTKALTWWRERRPSWAVLVLVPALLAQGTLALVVGARGWFSGDVVHYFVERGGLADGSEGLNEPHSGHWQPVLIVVYRMLFELFGLRSYVPYLLLTVVVHLVVVALLYALVTRLGAARWVALTVALAVLTYGAGSEAFFVEAPVALTAAVALGLGAVLVLVRGDLGRRSLLVGNAMLLVAVMLSVGGVVAAVLVGCFALSRGWRYLVASVAAPALAFTTWYLWLGRGGDRLYIQGDDWLRVPSAAATLLVQPLGDVSMVSALGATLTLAVLAGTLLAGTPRAGLATLALAGLIAAVTHAVLSSVAQVPFGIDQVLTSRYRYVVLVLLVPAVALALQTAVEGVASRVPTATHNLLRIALVALLVGIGVNAAVGQYQTAQFVADTGDETRERLRGMLAARSTGEVPITDAVRGDYISGFDLERLTEPAARTEIPQFEVDQADRIQAESRYFVAVTDDDLDLDDDVELPGPTLLESSSFEPALSNAPGCRRVLATSGTPSLTLTSYNGARITVTSRSGSIHTTLVRDEFDLRGDQQKWTVDPGEPVTIATTAQVAKLEVGFDFGDVYEICVP